MNIKQKAREEGIVVRPLAEKQASIHKCEQCGMWLLDIVTMHGTIIKNKLVKCKYVKNINLFTKTVVCKAKKELPRNANNARRKDLEILASVISTTEKGKSRRKRRKQD